VPRDDLVTIGESFEDLIFVDLPRLPGPGEEVKTGKFVRTIGGGAVITAIAGARLGLSCCVMSGLSQSAVSQLRAEGLAMKNLRRKGELSALTAALSTKQDRAFVTFNGINEVLEGRLFEPARRLDSRHVHFAFYPKDCARWVEVLEELNARGISTSWDFGWNEGLIEDPGFLLLLGALDYVFMNDQETLLYSNKKDPQRAVEYWRKRTKNIVIKRGPKGCQWVTADSCLSEPAVKVKVVDTTGAGDAFNGGFLCGILTGLPERESLVLGNRVGGLSTQMAGGIDGLPRWDTVK
jgi:sugar/nucleoside kinase (ribokinase family)